MNRERALELATKSCIVYLSNLSSWTVDELVKFANIIEDEVKAELLQEQEPVAWRCSQGITSNQQMGEVGWPSIGVSTEHLYTHPRPRSRQGGSWCQFNQLTKWITREHVTKKCGLTWRE